MSQTERISWNEKRTMPDGSSIVFFMIADHDGVKWMFSEQEAFDIRWYDIDSTRRLRKKVQRELAKQRRVYRWPRKIAVHSSVMAQLSGESPEETGSLNKWPFFGRTVFRRPPPQSEESGKWNFSLPAAQLDREPRNLPLQISFLIISKARGPPQEKARMTQRRRGRMNFVPPLPIFPKYS